MSEIISIDKQNEIMITWLLAHAGYYTRDGEKKRDTEAKVQMSPVECLRLVLERVNQEATT